MTASPSSHSMCLFGWLLSDGSKVSQATGDNKTTTKTTKRNEKKKKNNSDTFVGRDKLIQAVLFAAATTKNSLHLEGAAPLMHTLSGLFFGRKSELWNATPSVFQFMIRFIAWHNVRPISTTWFCHGS